MFWHLSGMRGHKASKALKHPLTLNTRRGEGENRGERVWKREEESTQLGCGVLVLRMPCWRWAEIKSWPFLHPLLFPADISLRKWVSQLSLSLSLVYFLFNHWSFPGVAVEWSEVADLHFIWMSFCLLFYRVNNIYLERERKFSLLNSWIVMERISPPHFWSAPLFLHNQEYYG